jgi:hypothetical protein
MIGLVSIVVRQPNEAPANVSVAASTPVASSAGVDVSTSALSLSQPRVPTAAPDDTSVVQCATAGNESAAAQTVAISPATSETTNEVCPRTAEEENPVPIDYGRKAPFQRALHALLNENLSAFREAVADDPSTLLETADEFPLLLYMYALQKLSLLYVL